ncbi:MAG: hypothetical protein ACHQEM_00925 [Chitinophagales bacterium]
MARIFFLAIVFYLLYRLVFELIIPVFKTTKTVRSQFKDMQDQMQKKAEAFQQKQQEPSNAQKPKSRIGEYIEFEEIKD